MISSTYCLDAPFFDVDSMNVVWHGHYVKYLELARCQLLDDIGFNYQDMECHGYMFPIIDLQIKYIAPIKFREKVEVVATLVEWELCLKIKYLIRSSLSKKRITKASTTQVAVNSDTGEMLMGSPSELIQKVEQYSLKHNSDVETLN